MSKNANRIDKAFVVPAPSDERVGDLYIEYIPLSDLVNKRHETNPKDHDEGAIASSMRVFGYTSPVLLNDFDGKLLAGHGRIDTLVELKNQGKPAPERIRVVDDDWLVPTIRGLSFDSPAAVEAYLIADNQLTIMGGWHEPALLASLQRLQANHEDLFNSTGFDADDVRSLMLGVNGNGSGGSGGGGEPQMSRADELQREWGTARGQLYAIPLKSGAGYHLLLCGDATQEADVRRLMGQERAHLVWTDPPYGVDYVGKTADALTIENDGEKGLDLLLTESFKQMDAILLPGAAIYVCHPAGALSVTFGVRFLAQGWRLHQTLVWVKDTMVMGRSDYHYKHEPILFGYKAAEHGRRGRFGGEGWYGDDSQTSVLLFDRPTVSEMHPTIKPTELISYCLLNSSIPGDIVYDPFGGSGSTMAACDQTQRQCRMIELDPAYTAVILQRMKDSGLMPKRVADTITVNPTMAIQL